MANDGRIRRVSSPHVTEPAPGTWSNCLVVNGVAYVAGMIARGDDGKIAARDEYDQAKAAFGKIRNLLEAAGGTMADVVKVTIFVTVLRSEKRFGGRAASSSLATFPQARLCRSRRWPSRR